jgi:hypothetical protein
MEPTVDLNEIIRLVKRQQPDRDDIVSHLQKYPQGQWTRPGYYQFVDSTNANMPGAVWQHDECIVLEQENEGDIVLDVLRDGRVGGIEFIDLIER